MADLTKSLAVRDSSATFTLNNGAASQTVVCNTKDERVVIYVKNTDATTARVKIAKGNGIRSILGDLKVDVAQNAEVVIGPLESARFKDLTTGKITVAITGTNDAAFGGTVANVKLAVVQLP